MRNDRERQIVALFESLPPDRRIDVLTTLLATLTPPASVLPIARNVQATAVANGASITIDVAAVSDFTGLKSALTITVDDAGLSGTASVDGNNNITYTPGAVAGSTSFTYTIQDEVGTSNSATVEILVTSAAPAPGLPDDDFALAVLDIGTPIAWYRFGEEGGATLVDTMGDHDGTYSGSPIFLRPQIVEMGSDERAVDFNAAAHAVVAHSSDFEAANITLTLIFTVKQSAIDNGRYIVTKAAPAQSVEGHFGLRYVSGDLRFWYQSNSGTASFPALGGAIAVDTKIAVTLAFWADGIRYYVNGELIGQDAARTAGWTQNLQQLLVAADLNDTTLQSAVTIDEAIIHGATASLEQIRALHEWTEPPPPDPAPDPGEEPGESGATTNAVSNYSQLASACSAASAGTIIQLADGGSYSGNKITISGNGTAANPIVVRAANRLQANVPGGFLLTGRHIILRDLDFNANVEGNDRVQIGGEDNQVWRCRFRYNGGRNNLHFTNGRRGRAMYCEFTVVNPNDDFAPSSRNLGGWNNNSNRHFDAQVGFCYFHDLPSKPAGEPYSTRARAAIGLNNYHLQSLETSNWRIHHCLLENCGNSRLNVKMSGNVVEYCTIVGKTGTNVSYSTDFNQRFGEDNIWRGCVSEGGDGFRVQGKGNVLISCESRGGTGCDVAPGDHDPPPVEPGNPRADACKLVDCLFTAAIGGMSWAGNLPARNTRIEAHRGSVNLLSKQTGTVQTGVLTETPVTPRRMLVSEVGPNGNGVE